MSVETIGYFFDKKKNAFTLVRLMLACMVIVGHALGGNDVFFQLTGQRAAATAVNGFFFLSGLLITASLLSRRMQAEAGEHIGHVAVEFTLHRVFRIWPALLLVLVVSAFVVGPLLTTLPLPDYFADGAPFAYVARMATLQSWGTQALGYHDLPGLFQGLAWGSDVNPPLWTLAPGVFACAVLLGVFLLAGGRRWVMLAGAGAVIIDALLPHRVLFFWLPAGSPDLGLLAFSFALGVVFACLKDSIRIHTPEMLAAWVLYLLVFRTSSIFADAAFLTAFAITLIWFATRRSVTRIRLSNDISYGVYLYGFLFQNILATIWPEMSRDLLLVLCLALAAVAGWASWVLVEKRSIRLGRRLSQQAVGSMMKVERDIAQENGARGGKGLPRLILTGTGSAVRSLYTRRRRHRARRRSIPALFDAQWYLENNPDAGPLTMPAHKAYRHYLKVGLIEGRRPNPEFDPKWYMETYAAELPRDMDPLAHYERHGWQDGADPSPTFSTSYYVRRHPESTADGACPLAHYLRDGRFRKLRTLPKKRILLVSTHCPSRGHAGGLRILDIYARLRAADPDIYIELFTQKNLANDWSYDLLDGIFDRVFEATHYDLRVEALKRLRPAPYHFDVVDFQFLEPPELVRAYRPLCTKLIFTPMECIGRAFALADRSSFTEQGFEDQKKVVEAERAVCTIVDEVVCVSEPDAEFLRSTYGLGNVVVLETGVSDIEFRDAEPFRLSFREDSRTVLYLAYFGSPTNVEALEWYLKEVHPVVKAAVPDYRLDVVGRGDLSRFKREADASVNIVGEVAEIMPEIAKATVGIAPALSGAGFRGKINQYAKLGVPTVASPLAAHGLGYTDGEDIFIGATGWDYADKIIRLLTNPDLRCEMGLRAEATCAALYSWESRDAEIIRLYDLMPKVDPDLPVVHVIVPSYRHARYLEQRILSILSQTYANIDLTVIDDCSRDNSDEILRKLQAKHRFRYFRRDRNSGTPFSAWQYAADNFHDGYVWICESDDFAEPEFLERAIGQFQKNPKLVLFYCNSWVVDEDGRRTGSTASYFSDVWKDSRWEAAFQREGRAELADYQLRGMTVPNMSSALIDAKSFRAAFTPAIMRFKLTGDWLFVGQLMSHGDVAFTPEHLSNFRTHGETARASVQIARSQAEFILTKFHLHWLARKSASDVPQTLSMDLTRFRHENASALQVMRAMLRVWPEEAVHLMKVLGYLVFVRKIKLTRKTG